jgi:hypothetical protein
MLLPMVRAPKTRYGGYTKGRGVLCALSVAAALGSFAGVATAKDHLDVRARDQCDPVTFGALCNTAFDGHVTRAEFQAAVPHGGHGGWKFNPGPSGGHLDLGGVVQVVSEAGETHTLTQVRAFGGGFVIALNAAVGGADTVPECATMAAGGLHPTPTGIIVPFGSVQTFQAGSTLFPRGIHLYQCCIHPWMRTIITVR